MQPLWLILTNVALLATPAAHLEDALQGGDGPIRQFSEMDSAARRQWVGGLLDRLDRANRVVLDAAESGRERSQYIEPLRQQLRSGEISQADLAKLVQTTDQREKAAIERLARQYRMQVYKTFRQRRGVFTRRRMAWNRVHDSWQEAGGQFQQQDRLIDWLEKALSNSTPEVAGPLPDEPAFDPLKRDRQAASREEVVRREPIEPTILQEEPAVSILLPPSVESLHEASSASASVAGAKRGGAQGTDTSGASQAQPPATPTASSPIGYRQPPGTEPAAEPPVPVRSAAPRRPALVESPAASDAPAQPASSVETRQPLPIPAGDDLPVEPVVISLPVAQPEPEPAVPPIQVNIDELIAHIAGANLELRALEADLSQRWAWDARQLGPLVDRLGRLMIRMGDLKMFVQLIPQQQRPSVDRLESSRAAISQLAAKIFETRTRVAGPKFFGSEAQRQAELRHLDKLSRELAAMASGK